MTTYTFTGMAAYYPIIGEGTAGIENNVTLELVVPASTSSLSYTLNQLSPGSDIFDQSVDISLESYTIRLNGMPFVDEATMTDPEISIYELVWKDFDNVSHTSTVLIPYLNGITVPGLGTVDADYIFVIGGDPLPEINSAADWDAFEGQLTGISIPTGAYGPGVDIPLADLGGVQSEDDTITGTDGRDVIYGGAGDDNIQGLGGNDKLFGGAGDDNIQGGDGNDVINPGDNTYYDSITTGAGKDKVILSDIVTGYVDFQHWDLDARIIVNIDGNANTGTIRKVGNGLTTIIDVKNPMIYDVLNVYGLGLLGTAFDDVFNVTVADGGWMQIDGSEGADSYKIGVSTGVIRLNLRGGTEGVEANLATGQIANDSFGNAETITGAGNVWELRSSMQDDTITGSAANESFILMAGTDTLDGGAGFDMVRYDRAGVDGVTVDLGAGTATGMWKGLAFSHSLSNIERVRGSDGNDLIKGSAGKDNLSGEDGRDKLDGGKGNDSLYGGAGNDTLKGGGGKDRLDGGTGNDKMTGGGGADTFVFSDGNDRITDFNAANNREKIDLSDVASIRNFKDLKNNHLSEDGGNVVIDDAAGNTLTLNGLDISDLDKGDFIF